MAQRIPDPETFNAIDAKVKQLFGPRYEAIGYASHPLLDTATVNGVKLFYPFSKVKCVFPMEMNHPHSYRLQLYVFKVKWTKLDIF
jgi:hypothetical protein